VGGRLTSATDTYEEVEWYTTTFDKYVFIIMIIAIPAVVGFEILLAAFIPFFSTFVEVTVIFSVLGVIFTPLLMLEQFPTEVGLSKYRLIIWYKNKNYVALPWMAIEKYKLTRIGSGVIVHSGHGRPIELRLEKTAVDRLLKYWAVNNPNVPLKDKLYL
jgi:hypothetical protein